METIVKYCSGDKLILTTCELCSNKASIILSTTSKAGTDLYVLKSHGLCDEHTDLITLVLTGEISSLENINLNKATHKMINLRG